MSSKSKKSKAQKARKNERRARASAPRPHTVEMPRPWWQNVGVFGLFALISMAWMGFCLWITGLIPDPALSYIVLAVPGAVSMALRPISARRQVLRWLAIWLLFWLSLPIAASAVYVIGSAWILKWAWDEERDKTEKNPANAVLGWLKRMPGAVRGAWKKSGDEAETTAQRAARNREERRAQKRAGKD